MANAQNGDTVRVHYTGKLDDGSQFDSSQGKDPLEFTIGSQMVIAGFDQGVIGMAPGDKKTVEITSVAETSVTLDANHPLAGKDLTFDIELVEIT